MPEPIKPVIPVSKPTVTSVSNEFKFDTTKLKAHLDKIIEYMNEFVGKRGHNPFIWIRDNVTPLYNRLIGISKDGNKVTPETTKELSDAILNLKEIEPKIPAKDDAPSEQQEQPKMVLTAAGIMVANPAIKK